MTGHEQLLSDHLDKTAADTRLMFTIGDVVNEANQANGESPAKGRLVFAAAACVAVVLGFVFVTAGNGNDVDAVATGSVVGPFDPADEVVIRPVEPNPSTDSYIWTAAFGIDGIDPLDSVNIGRMGPAELAAAGVGLEESVCRSTVWMRSINCDTALGPKPVRFDGGSSDTGAWLWTNLPDRTKIVQFTDQNADVSWQRPLNGTALFADTVNNDDGQPCECTFLAIDGNGTILDSYQLG